MTTTKELMSQLAAGQLTLDDVAGELEDKTFPQVQKSSGTIDTTTDPVAPGDDDFFWVNLAYDLHRIDDDEYEVLAGAAQG